MHEVAQDRRDAGHLRQHQRRRRWPGHPLPVLASVLSSGVIHGNDGRSARGLEARLQWAAEAGGRQNFSAERSTSGARASGKKRDVWKGGAGSMSRAIRSVAALLLLALASSGAMMAAKDRPVNFSGTWKL